MTTMSETAPSFSGIYGIPEVARYLAITPPLRNGSGTPPIKKLRYWIRTSVPYVAPSPYPTRQRLITFLDLVSMRMVAVLRARGMKLREIRATEKFLRKEFGLEWPFVSRELWTYGSHIYMHFHEHILAVSKSGQQSMGFVGEWLSKVEVDMTFDFQNIATSWSPYAQIRLDPKIQFGTPCIEGTRIPTHSIWSHVKAGDSLEIVASLYELTMEQTSNAVEWEKRLGTTRSRYFLRD